MTINFSREVPETRLQIQARQIKDLQRQLKETSELGMTREDLETLKELLRLIKDGKVIAARD